MVSSPNSHMFIQALIELVMHWTTDKRKKSETHVKLMKGIYELLSFARHACQLDRA